MTNRDIDDMLRDAAGAKHDIDPALLDRISKSLGAGLRPVRPLPPSWLLAIVLVLICAIVAVAGAMRLGAYGIQKLSGMEIALIFPVLAILIWLAAVLCVAELIPGSRRPLSPWLLLVSGGVALAAVFGLLFHDYATERFVSQGMKCLTAGLAHAVPAFLAAWLLLRRGVALNPLAAGLAKGTLAGLAGVTMLELHCPNFEAPHVMVWHIAVMPVSGAAGMLIAWTTRARAGREPGVTSSR